MVKRFVLLVSFLFISIYLFGIYKNLHPSHFQLPIQNAHAQAPCGNGGTCLSTLGCQSELGITCAGCPQSTCGSGFLCCVPFTTPTPPPTCGGQCNNSQQCCTSNRCAPIPPANPTPGFTASCVSCGVGTSPCGPVAEGGLAVYPQGTCCGGLLCAYTGAPGGNPYQCVTPTPTPTPKPTLAPPPSCTGNPYNGTCLQWGYCDCPQDGGSGTETCLPTSNCGPVNNQTPICCNIKVTPTPKPTPANSLPSCAVLSSGKGHCKPTCQAGTEASIESTQGPTDCSEFRPYKCCVPTGCGAHGGRCLTKTQLDALKGTCPFDYTSDNNFQCGSIDGDPGICCAPTSCYQGGNFCSTSNYCTQKNGKLLDPQASDTACRNGGDICCDALASAFNFGTCAGNNSLCTDSPVNPDIFGSAPTPAFTTETDTRLNNCQDLAKTAGVATGTNLYCCPINFTDPTNAGNGNVPASVYGYAQTRGPNPTPVLNVVCTDAIACPSGTQLVSKENANTIFISSSPYTCFAAADSGGADPNTVILGCQLPAGGQVYGTCADRHNYCTNTADPSGDGNCLGGSLNPPTYTTVADYTCRINASKNGLSKGHPAYCYTIQQRNLGQCSGYPDSMCTDATSCPAGRTPIYNTTSGDPSNACGKAAQANGIANGTVVHCCPLDSVYSTLPTVENGTDTQGQRNTNPINPCSGPSCATALGPLSTQLAPLITDIFRIILGLAGGIAVLLIIKSGYQFMVSRGNPEKLQSAKEVITSAIVGLLFLIFSIAILEIIGVDILQIPGIGK